MAPREYRRCRCLKQALLNGRVHLTAAVLAGLSVVVQAGIVVIGFVFALLGYYFLHYSLGWTGRLPQDILDLQFLSDLLYAEPLCVFMMLPVVLLSIVPANRTYRWWSGRNLAQPPQDPELSELAPVAFFALGCFWILCAFLLFVVIDANTPNTLDGSGGRSLIALDTLPMETAPTCLAAAFLLILYTSWLLYLAPRLKLPARQNLGENEMANHFDEAAQHWDDERRVAMARDNAAAIRQAMELSPTMDVLDYGCGTGLLSFALAPAVGTVAAADSSGGMLAVVREKIAAEQGDNVEALKLDLERDAPPARRFDLIVSAMAMHHVRDTAGVLKKIKSLLKPGGRICMIDLDAEDGGFHGPEIEVPHHGFARETLRRQAVAAGLGEVRFATVRTIRKNGGEFPVFLMSATADNEA